jgi:hypothetical protein
MRFWTNENTNIIERIGNYENLGRFIIDNTKIGNAKIFRLKKYFPVIIIREKLMEILIENKISGIGFIDTWELK